jgi:predicted Zn-dependent protease
LPIRHLLFIASLFSSLSLWAATPSPIDLPDIGGAESTALTPAQEQALTGQIAREVRRSLPVLEDPELNTYITAVGDRLVSSSPDAKNHMVFLLIDSSEINAFAAPGGVIAVNTGLITAAKDESEMAGVVAHEIAHVTQRHLARTYADQANMSLKTGLSLLAGLLIGAYNPDLGSAVAMTGMAATEQARLKYSRSNEQEADRIGIITLASAGYDPRGMPQFFQTLQKETGQSGDKIIEYLQTHPLTSSRISDSLTRAEQFIGNYSRNSDEFIYAQARIEALKKQPREIISDYKNISAAFKKSPVSRYKYAIALNRNNNAAESIAVLNSIKQEERTLAIELALGEALIKSDQNRKAIKHLSDLKDLYPTYDAINYLLAKAYLQDDNATAAINLLSSELFRESPTPITYRLLAEAASKDHRKGLSYEAMAEYYFAYGRYSEAMAQIDMALKSEDLKEIERQRIENKRDILKTWLDS